MIILGLLLLVLGAAEIGAALCMPGSQWWLVASGVGLSVAAAFIVRAGVSFAIEMGAVKSIVA